MLFLFIIIIISLVASLVSVIRIAIYGGSVIRPDFRKALQRINQGNMFSFLLENRFWYRSNVVGYYLTWSMWLSIVATVLYIIIR
ncbi:MAG: hypothetical protein VB046_08385 [Paludibacter sp.]|nr:hypothetical protein [Paludibacter sp.]